ncbi:MAG: SLBB domain-containing protein [Armatimonadetes bacterium]|nr:SLBB domain-containing protein [Armatimonadota bacterium]
MTPAITPQHPSFGPVRWRMAPRLILLAALAALLPSGVRAQDPPGRPASAPISWGSEQNDAWDSAARRTGAGLGRVEMGLTAAGGVSTYRSVSGDAYVVGPYDELEVSLNGLKPEKWDVLVSPQGTVTLPPLVGAVPCSGIRLAEVRDRLTAACARYYRNFRLEVVVTRLRGIEVTVAGQVVSPGPRPAAGLTRVWEAIQRGGGITPAGSVRSVRITRRAGGEESVDLYPFLFFGREEGNVVLESGDHVYVPVAKRVVGITGEVRRPGLYEFKEGESLADLLALSGGPTAEAALEKAYLERPLTDQQRDIIRVDLRRSADAPSFPVEPKDGDTLVVPAIGSFLGQVTINGEVRKPGTYERKENMRLRDLLDLAGGCKASAALSRAYIQRVSGDEKLQLLYVNAGGALRGDRDANVPIQEGDLVHVPDIRRLAGVVAVRGEVKLTAAGLTPVETTRLETRAGTDVRAGGNNELRFVLADGMRVSDLLRLAGGPTASAALNRARLVRIGDGGQKEAADVDLALVVGQPGGPADLALRDGDLLQVPSIAVLQNTVNVVGEVVGTGIFETAGGMVKRRGVYELKEGDTVRDLVMAVDGVTANAARRAARIERRGPDGRLQRIPVDLYRLLVEHDESANVSLQNGDEFIVPAISDMVYVLGAVNAPGAYEFREGTNTVLSAITRAGLSPKARLDQVYLMRADAGPDQKPVKVDMSAVVRHGKIEKDPGVHPGDIVYVKSKLITFAEMTQTLANVSLLRFYWESFR